MSTSERRICMVTVTYHAGRKDPGYRQFYCYVHLSKAPYSTGTVTLVLGGDKRRSCER